MGILRFFFKVILVLLLIAAVPGWLFYDYYKPLASNPLPPLQVNDITGLNPVTVQHIVKPKTEQEITDAVLATTGPISIGGARYSMGGQIAYPDSLHLDMRDFNQVLSLDTDRKLITVQSGITWRQIQHYIDPHNLSIQIMQDFNNFTVGGSLSVNAHGRNPAAGPIINSVISMKMVLSDGAVYSASPEMNYALFYGAIGGYGGLGVITEVTLKLTDNLPIERISTTMPFNKYLEYFRENIISDKSVVMNNAFLYPPNYETLRDNTWRVSDKALTESKRLRIYDETNWWKPALIDLIARFDFLKRLRMNLIDPMVHKKPTVVMRNYESSYDLHEFGFVSHRDSILSAREYFVPVERFEVFVLKLRDVFIQHHVNVLNISIRYSPRDTGSILSWAKNDVFSFVVMYQQNKDAESIKEVTDWSDQLNDAAIESGGSYYLPFQIQNSTEHFYKAYPNAGYYFEVKKTVDPYNRFNNLLWLAFNPDNQSAKVALSEARKKLDK